MGPSKASYCELKDNHDGTFVLKVKAQETGRHVLQIKYGGEHVNGECPRLQLLLQQSLGNLLEVSLNLHL